MSNEDNKFEFSDSTAVDVDGSVFKGDKPPKKTLQGHPAAAIPPAMVPDELQGPSPGTIRSDPPVWDDEDDDLGEKTAALDLSALGLIGPGGELLGALAQEERTIATGMPQFVEEAEAIDPNATMAMDLGSRGTAPPVPPPAADPSDIESTMAMDSQSILAHAAAAKKMPPIPAVARKTADQIGAVSGGGFNDTLADSGLEEPEEKTVMAEAFVLPGELEEPEEKTVMADAFVFPGELEEPEEKTMMADAPLLAPEFEEPEEKTMMADASLGEERTMVATPQQAPARSVPRPEVGSEDKTRMGSAGQMGALEEIPQSEATMMFDASALLAQRDDAGPQGVVTIIRGNDAGKEYFLRSDVTMVGRGLDCDLVLNDPSVSRKHFRIERRLADYFLVDLGSGNGTKLNGVRVADQKLEEGHTMEVGTTALSFGFVGSDYRAPVEVQYEVKKAGGGLKVAFMFIFVAAVGIGILFGGERMGWWNFLGTQLSEEAKEQAEKEKEEAEAEAALAAAAMLEDSEFDKAVDGARKLLSDKKLKEANDALDAAMGLEGANEVAVRNMKKRVKAAAQHKKLIAEQEKGLKAGKAQVVLTTLKIVPSTSPYFTDASALQDEATKLLVDRYLDTAYKLRGEASGIGEEKAFKDKLGQVKKYLDMVLALQTDNVEATEALEELKNAKMEAIAVAAAPTEPAAQPTEPAAQPTEPAAQPTEPAAQPTEPAAQPIDVAVAPTEPAAKPTEPAAKPTEPAAKPTEPAAKPTEPAAKPTEPAAKPTEPAAKPTEPAAKPVVAAAKPKPVVKPVPKPTKPRPVVKPKPQYERANLRAGYKLYSQRKFAAASAHLRKIKGKQYRRSDRQKATAMADKIDNFAAAYGTAQAAVKSFKPGPAIKALEQARKLDKGINGTYGGEIRRNLAQMYAFQAASAYSSSKFKRAAQLARKALTYNAGESSARLIYEKVEKKVEGFLASARSAKAAGNLRKAESQLKTVMGILPDTDARYKEARRSLNDLMAARAEEDDD